MRQVQYAFLITIALMLAACSSLPETPKQTLAASYIAVESLADTAYIAHRDGLITDEQRDDIRTELQAALDHLALAEQIITTGGDAETQLQAAHRILTTIQSVLQVRVNHE